MFIPLTINDASNERTAKNVLVAGDTASIFYLLAMLSHFNMNIYLADTGIKSPLREFPCHRSAEAKDGSNVYYDFFDGLIPAGIIRRMDAVITAGDIDYIAAACRAYSVPCSALHIVAGAATYQDVVGHVLISADNLDVKRPRRKPADVIKSPVSAWDRTSALLKPGERFTYNDNIVLSDDTKLIEHSIPELEILDVAGQHVELYGDIARVFDGLVI